MCSHAEALAGRPGPRAQPHKSSRRHSLQRSASRLRQAQPARASAAGRLPTAGPAAPCLRHELIQHAACEEVAGRHSPQRGDNVPIKAVSCQPPNAPRSAEAGPPHSGPCPTSMWVCPTRVACLLREWPQEAPGRTWAEEEVGLEMASS